jgi:hypothetical protein
MISFAKFNLEWLNRNVKNTTSDIKNKIISRYLEKDDSLRSTRSTDINVLLNRVRVNQKNESRKKMYFSAIASASLILFGLVIF